MIKGQKKKIVLRVLIRQIYKMHDSFLVDLFIDFGWIAQILPHVYY